MSRSGKRATNRSGRKQNQNKGVRGAEYGCFRQPEKRARYCLCERLGRAILGVEQARGQHHVCIVKPRGLPAVSRQAGFAGHRQAGAAGSDAWGRAGAARAGTGGAAGFVLIFFSVWTSAAILALLHVLHRHLMYRHFGRGKHLRRLHRKTRQSNAAGQQQQHYDSYETHVIASMTVNLWNSNNPSVSYQPDRPGLPIWRQYGLLLADVTAADWSREYAQLVAHSCGL